MIRITGSRVVRTVKIAEGDRRRLRDDAARASDECEDPESEQDALDRMVAPPSSGSTIYHITHLDNLPSIIDAGHLWSHNQVLRQKPNYKNIGLAGVKNIRQRKTQLDWGNTPVHPVDNGNLSVADFVPTNFCFRSVMLYVIHEGENGLKYSGGQEPILHLVLDLGALMNWAIETDKLCGVTSTNAAREGTSIYPATSEGSTGWMHAGMHSRDDLLASYCWLPGDGSWDMWKRRRQAEFLVHDSVPWELVTRIGVISKEMKASVEKLLVDAPHQPAVEVHEFWYYPRPKQR